MNLVNYNGDLISDQTPVFASTHRGFRYGDGLFETIRMQEGRMPLLHLHFQRLSAGLQALGMDIPPRFGVAFFEEEIRKILPEAPNARVRLSVFRKSGGLYAPETDEVAFLIEASPYEPRKNSIPETVILAGFPIAPSPYTPFKTSNSLPYVMASRQLKIEGWEEAVLLNTAGRVADGCYSNIFVCLGDEVYTPPVAEGALAGIARSLIRHWAQETGMKLVVAPMTITEIKQGQELFFANALSGIRYAHHFENRKMNYLYGEMFSQLWERNWLQGIGLAPNWINE